MRWGEEERREAHRAIGRYIVAFSELMYEIRMLTAQHIGGANWPRANLALGEVFAQNIAYAFFGLCREHAAFTKAEEAVATKISEDVSAAISMRNDVTHGDWLVGYFTITPDEPSEILPPSLVRIKPHRKPDPITTQEFTVEKIDALTDGLYELLTTVYEFGRLAFGYGIQHVSAQGVSTVKAGAVRVGDIFTLHPGNTKSGEKARVVRDGPQANSVMAVRYG
jgi:hypothetical protein